jgi:threonine synthase
MSVSNSVSLGEGGTPLVRSLGVGRRLGLPNLWYKLENCNPSGSYKDRFAAAEVARIVRMGARACVATSSGNTGSALSAYAARNAIRCAIVVNHFAPAGKLMQMRAHGARIMRVRDFGASPETTRRVFDDLLALSQNEGIPLVVSAYRYCPEGMAGVEPLGGEIVGQLGAPPAHVFVPVGSGGLFSALCRGLAGTGARVHAVQPAGCSTIVAAYERGDDEIRPVQSTTSVSGLSVPYDIDGSLALSLLREGGGMGVAVPDEEVMEAQRMMLAEGVYCEPAGATALAGLLRAVEAGRVDREATMVCIVSGHGFKDPDSIAAATGAQSDELLDPAELIEQLREAAKRG